MGAKKIIIFLAVAAVILASAAGAVIYLIITSPPPAVNGNLNVNEPVNANTNSTVSPNLDNLKFIKFGSETEFKDYLAEVGNLVGMGGYAQPVMRDIAVPLGALETGPQAGVATGLGVSTAQPADASRVSETNVQVAGIDEPDILKTDGKQIYYSQTQRYYYAQPMIENSAVRTDIGIMPPRPDQNGAETLVIKAFPPSELAKIGGIDKIGNLLISGKVLMVFANDQKIYGYDISDPKSPKEKWSLSLSSNSRLVQSRLYDNKLFIITNQYINEYSPCPLEIASLGQEKISVACSDIYHPSAPVGVDVTYTAMKIDANSGKTESSLSFIGASANSVVYMSPNAIYASYAYYPDMVDFMADFLSNKASDLVPQALIDKFAKLKSYDISGSAKLVEFQRLMNNFEASLDDDQRLKIENELSNRMTDYLKDHQREMEKSGLVKIGLKNFDVEATGDIPGRALNQFSLDEYNGYLRIAVTIGEQFGLGTSQSVSDVYVLGPDLKVASQVLDLGRGERIYSARFIEDKGYVVTFRQTDPFYVIDLSNPNKAELKGELKIPGYSSYLHPISKDRILGIGREQNKVKLSLFNVADAANPTEIAKYNLDEYWSEALDNHHAFLLDKDNKVFFMPGGKGGYVFSYANDALKLEAAVSSGAVKRALYLDNYLYIAGDTQISVLDEKTWKKIKEFDL